VAIVKPPAVAAPRTGAVKATKKSAGTADVATFKFLEKITQDLANGPLNLPCFPDIVPRVRKVLADPKSTAVDLVRIAGTEPRLAARLLQTANSAVFNPGGKPFGDLRQAVTRLGHHLVQSVTMAFAVQQMRADQSLRPVAQPLNDLWQRSIAVASICQVLANRLKVPGDKVFLAGLLHGIGYLYIMARAAEPASEVRYEMLSSEMLAESQPQLGRAILEKWGFEPGLCQAVERQRDYAHQSKRAADIADVLIASVALAEALLDREGDLSRCEGINAFASLRLEQSDMLEILKHTEYSLNSLRETLGC
jgi:HD-like signal output (HDOD) protein